MEQAADFGHVDARAVIMPVRHDVQQCLEGRACRVNALIFEGLQSHTALRIHDGIHAGGKQLQILLLRP